MDIGGGAGRPEGRDGMDGVAPPGGQEFGLERLVVLSRAQPTDLVSTAGPGGLALLGLLYSRGFERVRCVGNDGGPGDTPADVLLLAGHGDMNLLCGCLRRTVRRLRHGGVLACELPDLDDDRKVAGCLKALDLEVASTVFDLRDRTLVRHTVSRRPRLVRAA